MNSRWISRIFTPLINPFPFPYNTVDYLQASQSVKSNTISHHQFHCFLATLNHALSILSIKNIYFWLLNKLLDIKKWVLTNNNNQISKITPHHIGRHQYPPPREKNVIEINCKTVRRPLKQHNAKGCNFLWE